MINFSVTLSAADCAKPLWLKPVSIALRLHRTSNECRERISGPGFRRCIDRVEASAISPQIVHDKPLAGSASRRIEAGVKRDS